ncbi:type II toxin-antitoxin system antitoxin SocA domain-containing protein [Paenibacillus sp. FSL K6-1122]|uniref:Panacea domain-containing protein n=1 Tax=Paenibacillus sp. FSL K6-1122 TaxID=2954512 RepID=UPI0030EF0590
MSGMRELSSHIFEVASRNSLPVTNLHLQKVMYFSLGFHMRNTGEIDTLARETYDMPFEKWQYGPVVPTVYYSYNHFREKSIVTKGTYSSDYASWDQVILNLLGVDAFKLVQTSHELKGWADYRDDILNRRYVRPYTLEEILGDFKK